MTIIIAQISHLKWKLLKIKLMLRLFIYDKVNVFFDKNEKKLFVGNNLSWISVLFPNNYIDISYYILK